MRPTRWQKLGVVLSILVGAAGCTKPGVLTQTMGTPISQANAAGVERPRLVKMGVVGYPEELRQLFISGTVTTLTLVGKDGVPVECEIESQSFIQNYRNTVGSIVPLRAVGSIVRKDGSIVSMADLFDPLAIKAMMDSRFIPARKDGVAVKNYVREPITFALQ